MGYREDYLRQNPERHEGKHAWYSIPLVDGEFRYVESDRRFSIVNDEGSIWIYQKNIIRMEFSGDWIYIYTDFGIYTLMRRKG